jgi:hypothetical protein
MRIGFSGHRPNRLHIGPDRVAQVCNGAVAKSVFAMSALAEGSDRLFAEAALDLGFQLQAVLPMPVADYESTFEEVSTTEVFRRLLGRSSETRILDGSLADSKAAYEALGHAMVADCDILMCVWDGKPAAGRGGTPEVLEYALTCGRRVIWIDAADDRVAAELRAVLPTIFEVPLTGSA